MDIKIFIPDNIGHKPVTLYGHHQQEKDLLKFFVSGLDSDKGCSAQKIGTMNGQQKPNKPQNLGAAFAKLSQTVDGFALDYAYLSGKPVVFALVTFVIYDARKFQYLSHNEFSCGDNDIVQLLGYIKSSARRKSGPLQRLQFIRQKFLTACTWLAWIMSPLKPLFDQTAVHQHFLEWKKCLQEYSFDNSKVWTIIFDMVAGVCVLAFILYKGSFLAPGIRLMDFTELVVNQLRQLLQALKGSPVGLKLNVLLNNFFLDCFIYHVDLWWTFLVIVSPAIKYLFVPLAVLGVFGISFQLAMLSDLLILVSLHAHCFYIYSAVLYQIEIVGLQALWRVVLGRRKNVLRCRVESYDYYNRQLYIATLLFASLIFLLPTVLVYYVVFASLRFFIYLLTYLLMMVRKRILKFPICTWIRWLQGSYVNLECMEMVIDHQTKNNVTVVYLKPKCLSPWQLSLYEHKTRPQSVDLPAIAKTLITVAEFLKGLVKGEMMGFIQPERKDKNKND